MKTPSVLYTKEEGKNAVADDVMAMLTDVVARRIAAQVIERMALYTDEQQH